MNIGFAFRRAANLGAFCIAFSLPAFAQTPASEPSKADFVRQMGAELSLAPAELRKSYAENEERFRNFLTDRLHDERIAQYARDSGVADSTEVRAVIGSFERDTLVQAAVKREIEADAAALPPLEPLARERYLADRDAYRQPETARIAHILVRADVELLDDEEIAQRKELAESLAARARAGEDFGALAREFSEDRVSAANGGELPRPATRDSLVRKFADAAWSLKPGEISDVVRTRFGFHVIRLLEIIPSSVRPFDEVKGGIIAKLRDDLLAPKKAEFVDRFRDAALEAEAAALLSQLRPALQSSAAPASGATAN